MYLNIISKRKGGGAELLVHELHRIFLKNKKDSHAIYFIGSNDDLEKNEVVFDGNLRNPFNIFKIRKYLRKKRSNTNKTIVHSHLTWPFFYTTLATIGLSDVILVYTEHNTTNKRRKLSFLRIVERLFYSRYNKIICISNGVHESLAEWLGPKLSERLITIPNGSRIYTLKNRATLKERLPNLISVGSLSHKKNFATTIRAIAKIKDEINSYTIVGEGSERQQLENIINDEGLNDKVKLIGWSDNIEELLHAADIQLIPSLWEGFGLVAVEGMSTGLPIIASNVQGLSEVLGDENPAITLINEIKPSEIWAKAIRDMVKKIKHDGVDSIATNARLQAEKFNLDNMADRYLKAYDELLE